MARSTQRWMISLALFVVVGILATLLILHDASASTADSITHRTLAALGMHVAPSQAPRIVFHDPDSGPITRALFGDTLVASYDAGDTILNQDHATEIVIENAGDAPLTLQLEHVSCACFRHIKLNGYIMGLRDRSATLAPGELAVLKITLKSDPDEIRVEDLPKVGRFGVTFNMNIPTASKLRVEATSRLVAGEATGKPVQAK